MSKYITLSGVETHNLKNIDVKIPKNKMTVVTGVSGSGKSSLAFTTLCAEGQRRYLESLSTYARMFVGGMKEEAKVREIEGITPTISIDQKTVSHNPRSTVGTITEIYDYYRLLFLHLGVQHCPECDVPLQSKTKDDVIAFLSAQKEDERYYILSPIEGEFIDFQQLKEFVVQRGFVRFFSGGEAYSLSDEKKEGFNVQDTHWVIVDRLITKNYQDQDDPELKRLHDSLSVAFEKGEQTLAIYLLSHESLEVFSRTDSCLKCGYAPKKLTLSSFSFNSPHGACEKCHGLGYSVHFAHDRILNPDLTLEEGALLPWGSQGYYYSLVQKFAEKQKIPRDTIFSKLTTHQQDLLLHGDDESTKISLAYVSGGHKKNYTTTYK